MSRTGPMLIPPKVIASSGRSTWVYPQGPRVQSDSCGVGGAFATLNHHSTRSDWIEIAA